MSVIDSLVSEIRMLRAALRAATTTSWHPGPKLTPIERFLLLHEPEPNSGCWLWVGHYSNGYGRFWFHGRNGAAHRASYEMFVGTIPVGMQIDHKCQNKICVNPHHLQLATPKDNVLRSLNAPSAINARKTTCANGHSFDALHRRSTRGGFYRACKSCGAAKQRRLRATR